MTQTPPTPTPVPALLFPPNSTLEYENSSDPRGGEDSDPWGPRRDPLFVVVPVTVYYAVIFVSGVVGNVSTCVVISRNKYMHTATNYYLFSLAISDLLLLLSGLPPEMCHIWSNYPYMFSENFCILSNLASETSANATVLTITAFTVERYVAICHPFLSHTVSKLSRAVKFVIAIWTLSVCLAVPQAIQMGVVYLTDTNGEIIEEYSSCTLKHTKFASSSFFLSSVLFFLAPMTLITVLYVLIGVRLRGSGRRRPLVVAQCHDNPDNQFIVRGSQRNGPHSKSTKRVVKMLVSVVVAFFICWAPYQVQRLYAIHGFSGEKTTQTDILVYKVMTYASGLLYYLSTTINPLLYNIMSLKFRQAFKNTLTKCLGQSEQRPGELASSGGGIGGGTGRLKYVAMSRCSSRNNNSGSSGGSYAEALADPTRRPLVVSFRRRSPKTSCSSIGHGCEQPPATIAPSKVKELPTPPESVREDLPPPPTLPVLRDPHVEDIEIFQESRLKIQRSVRCRQHEPSTKPESSRSMIECHNNVSKSVTEHCLTPH